MQMRRILREISGVTFFIRTNSLCTVPTLSTAEVWSVSGIRKAHLLRTLRTHYRPTYVSEIYCRLSVAIPQRNFHLTFVIARLRVQIIYYLHNTGRWPENGAHNSWHKLVYSMNATANVNNDCFKVLCTVKSVTFPADSAK